MPLFYAFLQKCNKVTQFKSYMKQIIDIIKSQINECKNTGDMFEMPPLDIEGVSVI